MRDDAPVVGDDDPSDATLVSAVRAGDINAFALLYRRYADVACRVARRCGAEPADQEDLAAEAFARVLTAIRSGGGPQESLRPYLLVTVRNLAIRGRKRHSRTELYRPATEIDDTACDPTVSGCDELVVWRWRSRLAWSAFLTLPPRWRAILWLTEVDQAQPSEVAPVFGLSPNGTSALATRAREGLRKAYLQVHIPEAGKPCCRSARERMGTWIRGDLATGQVDSITRHLNECRDCHAVAAELAEINRELQPPTGRAATRQRQQTPRDIN